MVVLGNSSRLRRAVFVVDASSALSGIFNLLLTEYVVPCIEYLNGGPLAEKQLLMQTSSPVQYGVVSVSSSMLAIPQACTYYPVTSDPVVLMQYLRSIRFEGGLIEQYCNASEGLAASMEFLDMMDRFSDSGSRPDIIVEKHCIFVTNLPPSSLPALESIKYGGRNHFQLAELMCKESVNLSIISPRWLSPYKELFLKASPSPESALLEADHALHHSCMVLLMGVDVPSLKARKIKREPPVSTTPEATPPTSAESVKQEISQGSSSVSVPMPSPAMPCFSPASVPAQTVADKSPKMQLKHSPHPATPSGMQMDTFMHLSPKSEPTLMNPPSVGSVSGITSSLSDPTITSKPQVSHTPVPSPGNSTFSSMAATLASSMPMGLSPHSKPSASFAATSFTSSLSGGSYSVPSLPSTAISQSLFPSSSVPSSSFSSSPFPSSSVPSSSFPSSSFPSSSVPSSSFPSSSVPSSSFPSSSVPSSFSGGLSLDDDSGPAGSSRSVPIQLDSPVTDIPRNIGPPSSSISTLASSMALSQQNFPLASALSCSSTPSLIQSSASMNTAPLTQSQFSLPSNMSTGSMPASSIPSLSSAAPIVSSMSTLSTLLTSSHSSITQSSFSQPTNLTAAPPISNTASLPGFPQSGSTTDVANPAVQAAAKILQEANEQARGQGSGISMGAMATPSRGAMTGLNSSLPMPSRMAMDIGGMVPGSMSMSVGASQVVGMGQGGSQPGLPGLPSGGQPLQQPQQPSVKIWTGSLESVELRGNQRIPRQIKCSIFTNKQENAQDFKVDLWPNRMTITIYPKTLLNMISTVLRSNHNMLRKVTFQFLEPIQNFPVLKALMMSPDAQRKVGIIQMLEPMHKNCPIKAFLVVWTDKQKQFTGLVPLDQKVFLSTLKQTIMHQKLQQHQMQQAQGMQQSQQPGLQQQGMLQGMQQQGMQQQGMQQQGMQQQGMQQQGMQQQGMQQQGMQQPGMQQPGMQQPGMQQPGMLQPGMQQPGMQQPGMQQQGMQQPGIQQRLQPQGMQQQGMQQPAMQQQGMQQQGMQQPGMQRQGIQQQGMQQQGMHQPGMHQQANLSSLSQPTFSQTSSTSASGMMTTGMVSQSSTIAGQLPISTQPTTFTQQAPQNQAPRPPFSHIPGMGPTGGEGGVNVSSSQHSFTGLSTSTKPGSSIGLGQQPMASSVTQQRMSHPGMTGQQQQQSGAGMMQQVGGMGMMPQPGGMMQSQVMPGGMGVMQPSAIGFPNQQQQQQSGIMQQGGMLPPNMGGGMPPQLPQPHHTGVMQTQPPAGLLRQQPMTQGEKMRLFLQSCPPEQKQMLLQKIEMQRQKLRQQQQQQQSFGAQQPAPQQQQVRMAGQQQAMIGMGMRSTLPPQQQQQQQQHPGAGAMDPTHMYFTN